MEWNMGYVSSMDKTLNLIHGIFVVVVVVFKISTVFQYYKNIIIIIIFFRNCMPLKPIIWITKLCTYDFYKKKSYSKIQNSLKDQDDFKKIAILTWAI